MVEAVSPLPARLGGAHRLVAPLDVPASDRGRYDGGAAGPGGPQHQVEDAAGEAGVEREVVRQVGEVVGGVAADVELLVHVEVGQLAGGQARDVVEVVNLGKGKIGK